MKTYPLVIIEWMDSMQPVSPSLLEQSGPLAVVHRKSVGWLVGETADMQLLAPTLGNLQKTENAGGRDSCESPIACITRETLSVEAT